eukprot:augustus_masked-scaffold_41-processed-gene-0.40-mRNA-1 protein AED:1.00 eAED:1.00 QI:0/-1/0/0/-1/1/1/0/159
MVLLKTAKKATCAATFHTDELANAVTDVYGVSDRILRLVVKLSRKSKVVFTTRYAPQIGHGTTVYKEYLSYLKKTIRNFDKKRLVLNCGDSNAQVARNNLNKSGELGFSFRANDVGKLLVKLLKEKNLHIFNQLTIKVKKSLRNMLLSHEERIEGAILN